MLRKASKMVLFTAVLCALLFVVQAVFTPASISRQSWRGYLNEEKGDVDVLFAGTSHVYSAIDPNIVDKAAGNKVHSYVLSGSGQSMALTYYTIKEALRTQEPEVVAVEAFRIIGKKQMAENNAMANFHYMPLSLNIMKALFATTEATARERIGIPLVTYHSRWSELKRSDFALWRHETNLDGERIITAKNNVQPYLRGYSKVEHTTEVEQLPRTVKNVNIQAWNENYPYLDAIARLCKKHKCKLVLFWTPNAMVGQTTYINRIKKTLGAQYPNITYIDYNVLVDDGIISEEVDFADQTHVNTSGAQKVSIDMGKRLATICEGE